MKFWDSSALVPLLVNEPATNAVTTLILSDSKRYVWWAAGTECVSALSRRLRTSQISAADHQIATARLEQSRQTWIEVPPSMALRDNAERLLRAYALRTADALQLAAAMDAADGSPDTLAFVCLDKQLTEAARGEGFTVEP